MKRNRKNDVARPTLLVVALAVLALAGCGGGGDAGNDPAAFRAEAGPLCEQLSKAIAEVAPPETFPAELDDFDRASSELLEATRAKTAELAALEPPAELASTYDALVADLESSLTHAERVQAFVVAGNDDTDALWEAATSSDTARSLAMEKAETLDLEGCTRLVAGHHH